MSTMRRRILMGLLPLTAMALVATAVGLERAMDYDLRRALDAQLLSLVKTVGGGIGVEVDGKMEFELSDEIEAQFQGEGPKPYYRIRSMDGKVLRSSKTPGAPPWTQDGAQACGLGAPGYRVCAAAMDVLP